MFLFLHAKCILSGWKLSAWRLQVWKLSHHHVKLKWWKLCSAALQWDLLQLRFFGPGWLGSTVTRSRKPIALMSVWGCRVKLWGLRGIRARDGLPVQSHLQSLHFWMSSRIRARGGLLEHHYRDVDFVVSVKFGAESLWIDVLSRVSDAWDFRFEVVGLEVSILKVVTQARAAVMKLCSAKSLQRDLLQLRFWRRLFGHDRYKN
jgi:hypothetical protein